MSVVRSPQLYIEKMAFGSLIEGMETQNGRLYYFKRAGWVEELSRITSEDILS